MPVFKNFKKQILPACAAGGEYGDRVQEKKLGESADGRSLGFDCSNKKETMSER